MKILSIKMLSIALSALVFNTHTFAQNGNKVVVIPLFGDEASASSGIEYSAGSGISITTPDPMTPNQQVISFDPTGVTLTSTTEVETLDPYLGLNYIIALQGTFPSRSSITDPTLGEITLFGGNFAPRAWAFCSGQLLPIASNTALFSILGTQYGGDGRSSFGLPDLRGRVAVGAHGSTGPGLREIQIGEKGGAQQRTLQFQVQ